MTPASAVSGVWSFPETVPVPATEGGKSPAMFDAVSSVPPFVSVATLNYSPVKFCAGSSASFTVAVPP